MTAAAPLMLDHIYAHEAQAPQRIFMTQPLGGGPVVDYTWGEVMDQARRMAAHLQSRNLPRGARVAMLSKNCAHFIVAELAIWMGGYTTVAIFPTETAETVRYVLEHSEASLLFVGKLDTWEQQRPGVPSGLPMIALPLAPAGHGLPGWDALIASTPALAGQPARAADELAMIMYTSGSTGTPKGVMVDFGGFTRAATGICEDSRKRCQEAGEARMLSYLPLAHSFERSWVEGGALVDGHMHLYFAESLDTFIADIQRARPTRFVSVPRLWLKFQQGVHAKMPAKKLNRLLGLPLLGKLVGRKVLKGLGLDQVLLAGSGSAPIAPELITWYRRLGLPLFEGYGMTEDNSYSHSSTAQFNAPGYVGVAMAGVQVRISDEGEVLIKSPGRMKGYYKQPELDAESFTADGFFRTGDQGELRPDGLLKITGRVKDLFKTGKGKYIAPAPIETRLNAHPMLELSMVSGVGQAAPYALVQPAEALRPRLAEPAVRAEMEAAMGQLLGELNAGLPDYSRLHMIVVAREPWSIDNGKLTPTMKIKRAGIEKGVADQVDGWYRSSQRVQWA
jgi:long-chain acyl-CoA synthetase